MKPETFIKLQEKSQSPITSLNIETFQEDGQVRLSNDTTEKFKPVSLSQIIIIVLLFFLLSISWATFTCVIVWTGNMDRRIENLALESKPEFPDSTDRTTEAFSAHTESATQANQFTTKDVETTFEVDQSTEVVVTTENPIRAVYNCKYKETFPIPDNDSGYVSVEKKIEELTGKNSKKVQEIGTEEIYCNSTTIYKTRILFNQNKTTSFYCEGLGVNPKESFRCGLYNIIQFVFKHKEHIEKTLVEYEKWLPFDQYFNQCW